MKIKLTAKHIAVIGLTAAVYTVLTLALPFLSYGNIQCRFSEVMNLLAFVNPVFAPGIVLGCFISNLFSPNGALLDCIFGTAATICTMLCITRSKNLFVASLWPTVFCVFIGAELTLVYHLDGQPYSFITFLILTGTVMLGEFIAMTVIGYPLFRYLMKNKSFMDILKGI